ncbi:MAG: TetR/AcrR family transcriptional regulator [Bacillota bacterium]|nr:TetR/AcrR family transcriptional regulator [Bacillota bacterium]
MNQNYFQLPEEKQNKLLNAGYKLFSIYPYKKASMAAVTEEAGISKSLLFYYFKNKKEFYLFLFKKAVEFMNKDKTKSYSKERIDLFDAVNLEVERRMRLLKNYPFLLRFTARVYYETNNEVASEISIMKNQMTQFGKKEWLNLISSEPFEDENDIPILINIILHVAEGCMRGIEDLDPEKLNEILPEFQKMMDSLKKRYYKKFLEEV